MSFTRAAKIIKQIAAGLGVLLLPVAAIAAPPAIPVDLLPHDRPSPLIPLGYQKSDTVFDVVHVSFNLTAGIKSLCI